jgi:SAM-dependent methyltransferase
VNAGQEPASYSGGCNVVYAAATHKLGISELRWPWGDDVTDEHLAVGPASARKLGYGAREIDALPASVSESFCGVGNPLGLGDVRPGQTVLDLGSGAGLDCLLAARRVGPTGKLVGVRLWPEMVEKARRNAWLLGLHSAEFVNTGIEKLPLPDGWVKEGSLTKLRYVFVSDRVP